MSEEKPKKSKKGIMDRMGDALFVSEADAKAKAQAMAESAESAEPEREPLPPGTVATPDALAKLRTDIGLFEVTNEIRSFLAIVSTLAATIPDEKLRYQTAVELSAKMQLITSDMVLKRYKDCIEQLYAKATEAEKDIRAFSLQTVGTKRGHLEDAQKLVAVKRQQLAELEATVAKHQAELQVAQAAVTSMALNFQAAYDAVLTELQAGESKFKTLLDIK